MLPRKALLALLNAAALASACAPATPRPFESGGAFRLDSIGNLNSSPSAATFGFGTPLRSM